MSVYIRENRDTLENLHSLNMYFEYIKDAGFWTVTMEVMITTNTLHPSILLGSIDSFLRTDTLTQHKLPSIAAKQIQSVFFSSEINLLCDYEVVLTKLFCKIEMCFCRITNN